MGGHHARIARTTPGASVTAVVDSDPDKGRQLASFVGAEYLSSLEGLSDKADAAIVSVPTSAHAELA